MNGVGRYRIGAQCMLHNSGALTRRFSRVSRERPNRMFFTHLADVLVPALTGKPEWATFMAFAFESYKLWRKKGNWRWNFNKV